MSWMQKLYETYERSAGLEFDGAEHLMPVSHTTQQAHIEIVIDGLGNFRRASVLQKTEATTLIPCTEESGGRAGSKPVCHPLCDKLQYIAGDFLQFGGEVTSGYAAKPEEPHLAYKKRLYDWNGSIFPHPKLKAISAYVERGGVIQDLVASGLLPADAKNKLLKQWNGEKDQAPPIFKVMANTQEPQDAFVRWRVEELGVVVSSTWQDPELIDSWISYYNSIQTYRGYCMVSGQDSTLAIQHPAKLRHAGDKAKLISANDSSGYTYRGKFIEPEQAVGVGFDITQKAHNALRWLIQRQGYRNGDQIIVSWAIAGTPIPDPFSSSLDLFGFADASEVEIGHAETAQAFALQLAKVLAGYRARLKPSDDILVMAVDSATPGRMAITFYRELKGSEFLERVESWHKSCAWPQNFGKDNKFIGAPAPKDIAEAAFGRRLDEKLSKATVERLLPCIVDGQIIPRDLLESTKRRACNRVGLDNWEWEKCLGIACALHKVFYKERSYQMSLETDRTTRDYLYGRLLAIAECVEGRALYIADEKRTTTAARLMQRFSDRPFSTWKTIELALVPYQARLRAQRTGFLVTMDKLLDEVICAFKANDYTSDAPLSGEFLLGYHCQRSALRPSTTPVAQDDLIETIN